MLILLSACKEDEPTPATTDQGCMTAVNGNGDQVFLRCCTQKQFSAGSNVSQGGYANWSTYTSHKWEKCAQCQ